MFLLDTNVVSELRRKRPHGAVLAWLDEVSDHDLHLSAVTIGELQSGIECLRGVDDRKADELEGWLEQILKVFDVISVDAAACRRWAKLMRGIAERLWRDAMIAATADIHGFTVVTRDVKDFAGFDVPVLNPFKVA